MKNYQENKVKLDLELLTRLSAACETVLSGLLEKAKASDPGPARLIVLEMHLIFGMYEHMFKKQCSPDVKKQCSKLYSARCGFLVVAQSSVFYAHCILSVL